MADKNPHGLHVPFYFGVEVGGTDIPFQTAEGLEFKMGVEDIKEGGENRFSYRVPGRMEFQNLKLKRALKADPTDTLVDWCKETLSTDLSKAIETKNIQVSLYDETGSPIATWYFESAYPINWRVDALDSMKDSDVLIEEIEFAYLYASRKK